MAELILTDEEKAAPLWTDLSDEALGRLVKWKVSKIKDHAAQLDQMTSMAACILLCCIAAESNAGQMTLEAKGVTQAGREFGDWIVTATRTDVQEGESE